MSDTEVSPLRAEPQAVPRITKAERTRTDILNAALEFLWTRPFREMTVGLLMASTDVGRSAFYQYFDDLHDLMETLLDMVQEEIFAVAEPWIEDVGNPVALMRETIGGLVRVCYERGPFIKAISDATGTDPRLAEAWSQFLGEFDDAASARIQADQQQGLIPRFEARPVAFALNRLNASTLIDAFGQHPRIDLEPVREALTRIWVSTLYGNGWFEKEPSDLVRT